MRRWKEVWIPVHGMRRTMNRTDRVGVVEHIVLKDAQLVSETWVSFPTTLVPQVNPQPQPQGAQRCTRCHIHASHGWVRIFGPYHERGWPPTR